MQKLSRIAVALSCCVVLAPMPGQTPADWPPLTAEVVAQIPADLRDKAAQLIRMPLKYQQEWTRSKPDELRLTILNRLISSPEAADLVLDKLPGEEKRTRGILLRNMPYITHWHTNARLPKAIEEIVAKDPDAEIVEQALDTLARIRLRPLKEFAVKRVATDMERSGRSDLLAVEERWISLERGTMLPRFLQEPPPIFRAPGSPDAIRWVAFGDFGNGRESQTRTAAAVVKEHRRKAFDFGITLGDNFYTYGMYSPSDTRWKPQWEELYGGMGIPFYSSLGNHDWFAPDSPAAEILYSHKSASWRMPATHYTYTAGPVQFFVIDTDGISQKQLVWLDAELERSSAKWRVVYGHFPVFVAAEGLSGSVYSPMKGVWEVLKKRRADLYIAGHHHSLQHMKPREGVELVISGGGGATSYDVLSGDDSALFARSVYGFTAFEADPNRISFRHIDWDGNELYKYSFAKRR